MDFSMGFSYARVQAYNWVMDPLDSFLNWLAQLANQSHSMRYIAGYYLYLTVQQLPKDVWQAYYTAYPCPERERDFPLGEHDWRKKIRKAVRQVWAGEFCLEMQNLVDQRIGLDSDEAQAVLSVAQASIKEKMAAHYHCAQIEKDLTSNP